MPNHVTHRMTVSGPADKVQAFKDHCIETSNDDPFFDFNTIIPMPEILGKIESGSRTNDGIFALTGQYKYVNPLTFPWAKEKGITTQQQFLEYLQKESPSSIEQGKLSLQAKKETGYNDWYDWSIHNWGTKWNSYSFKMVKDEPGLLEFLFNTAWSPPDPIFEKLAEMFGEDLVFEIVCFDEGWGFAVEYRIEDGHLDSDQLETDDISFKRVYGEFPIREEDEEY